MSLFIFDLLPAAASDSSSYFDDEDSCDDDDDDDDMMMVIIMLMTTTKIMILSYCKLSYLIANSVRYLSSSFHLLFFLLSLGII
jgi:hypothetical protein